MSQNNDRIDRRTFLQKARDTAETVGLVGGGSLIGSLVATHNPQEEFKSTEEEVAALEANILRLEKALKEQRERLAKLQGRLPSSENTTPPEEQAD